ncbi:hypothetical protein MNBD_DELTA01-945 [hydrothermal vent metagenome]|uniref:Phosphate-selective porin O and P n=1 Tax=hydrothermal vent metagenome TaxID=652676 RepID=A0A3B0QTJ1_9ZZZZ
MSLRNTQKSHQSVLTLLIGAIFLGSIFLWTAPATGADGRKDSSFAYKLGKGIPIAKSRLRLGGYSSIEFEDAENEEGKITFEDFSIFIYGDIGVKTSVFSEFENSKFLEIEEDGKTTTKENWQVERLYIDHLYKEGLNIRFGKFLTPIGSWNELHADPLTWTVSRPLVTYAAFPEFITGTQLFGDLTWGEQDLTYVAVMQNNESINERTGFRKTHLFYSAKIKWLASPKLEIGIPAAYYTELYINDRVYLTGLEFTYRPGDLELRSETTYSRIDLKDGGWSREYGYYLQGTHPVLRDNIFLVLRHEYFRARINAGKYKALSLGAVYKPVPQIVFKVEYKKVSGSIDFIDPDSNDIENADIWLASFSILL